MAATRLKPKKRARLRRSWRHLSILRGFVTPAFRVSVGRLALIRDMLIQQALEQQPHSTRALTDVVNSQLAANALKDGCAVEICYQPFYANAPYTVQVKPLQLREHRNRWYLVCRNVCKNDVRLFAFDRLKAPPKLLTPR